MPTVERVEFVPVTHLPEHMEAWLRRRIWDIAKIFPSWQMFPHQQKVVPETTKGYSEDHHVLRERFATNLTCKFELISPRFYIDCRIQAFAAPFVE